MIWKLDRDLTIELQSEVNQLGDTRACGEGQVQHRSVPCTGCPARDPARRAVQLIADQLCDERRRWVSVTAGCFESRASPNPQIGDSCGIRVQTLDLTGR